MDFEVYEEEHQVSYDEDQDMEGLGDVPTPVRGATSGHEGAVGGKPATTVGAISRRRRRRQKPKKAKKLVTQKRKVVKVKDIEVVMLRAWVFRASGGLGLLCIGPRAGRAFLYRASGLFRAF